MSQIDELKPKWKQELCENGHVAQLSFTQFVLISLKSDLFERAGFFVISLLLD